MAISLAKQAAEHGWSVREVEHRVQQLASGKVTAPPKKAAPKARPQADIVTLERELSESLGSRVEVVPGRGKKGKLVIHYADFDVLDGVLDRLRTKP
jgi:ParB family chromosome partitioning protein